MKVAFFGYAWNPAMKTDAYMAETIEALARAGVDVDVFLGSQLSKEYGIYGLNEVVPVAKLARLIASEGYAAAISFNNAMLIPEVQAAVAGRIVTVIVDEPEHLFDYYRAGPFEVFRQDIEVVAMSSALERRLTEAVDGIGPRLHFMAPATQVDLGARSTKAIYPISWVASYVGDFNLDHYLALITERPEFHALTIKCLEIIEREGDLRSVEAKGGADMALIGSLPWSFSYFQAQMFNILTNRARVAAVERLSPHGLALFGNPGWHKLMTYNAAVLASLQSGPPAVEHADLCRIYNASKVSINLPQQHTAQGAIQYRMIDVMASNALLLTRESPVSDLHRVFGEDCPVPTYADLDELERLCVHYLGNETERRRLVAKCNALVAEGFSFLDRARDLLRVAGLAPRAGSSPGAVRRIDLRLLAPDV
jgi:hypothetical protein